MNRQICAAVLVALLAAGCAPSGLRPDSRERLAPQLAGALALPATLPAADAPYPELREGELDAAAAVSLALRNNPRVRQQLARLDLAHAERIQAGLVRNPMFSLMALRPSGGGRFELDYGLTQSLFDLFSRSRRVQVADARQDQVEAEVLAALLDIARDTELAYDRAVTSQTQLEIEQQRLAIEQESLRVDRAQAASGAASLHSSIAQQAAVSMQAHGVETASADVSRARSELAHALGLSSAVALRLPKILPASALPEARPQALAERALARSPELAAAQADVDAERAQSRLEATGLRSVEPSLGLAGTRESGGLSLNGLQVQLNLPVFDRGQGRSALAAARIQQAQAGVEVATRDIPLQVEQAWSAVLAADSAAGHANHHFLQERTLEDLATRNYRLGSEGFSEYLQARRKRLDSERDLAQARLATQEAAVELRRVTASAVLGE